MKQRIMQFIKSITARVTKEEYQFVEGIIGEKQQLVKLFRLLPVFEQRHCIDVANTINERFSEGLNRLEKDILVKAALLHDIGKLNMGLNPITKSVAVIFDKISRESAMRLTGRMKFMNGYYNHPQMGKELLELCNVPQEVTYLVGNHHDGELAKDNKLLNILLQADELN